MAQQLGQTTPENLRQIDVALRLLEFLGENNQHAAAAPLANRLLQQALGLSEDLERWPFLGAIESMLTRQGFPREAQQLQKQLEIKLKRIENPSDRLKQFLSFYQ